jgi:hypothetical protein
MTSEKSDWFEKLKASLPELNWQEAEEISTEDLEAGAEFYDRLLTEVKKGLNENV